MIDCNESGTNRQACFRVRANELSVPKTRVSTRMVWDFKVADWNASMNYQPLGLKKSREDLNVDRRRMRQVPRLIESSPPDKGNLVEQLPMGVNKESLATGDDECG